MQPTKTSRDVACYVSGPTYTQKRIGLLKSSQQNYPESSERLP
jgi:hypothetical protein